MLTGAILSIREGVEAALLIGIIFSALQKTNRLDLRPTVWVGVFSAIGASFAAGLVMMILGTGLDDSMEPVFEGITMLLAAGLLTWMVLWMSGQSRRLNQTIGDEVKRAAFQAGKGALFSLAFLAVFREGVELAIYLFANRLETGATQTAIGALIGLFLASILGWIFFHSTRKVNLRRFFQVTNVLLVLFAAGLITHSVHELIEVGWVPPIIPQVWNLNAFVNSQSLFGQIAGTLFGYSPTPSLVEILAYTGYIILLGMVLLPQFIRSSGHSKVVKPDA